MVFVFLTQLPEPGPLDLVAKSHQRVFLQVAQVTAKGSDYLMKSSDEKEAANEIKHHGQIHSMQLPDKWIEAPKHVNDGGIGTRSLRVFHPLEAAEAKLCLFYRGLPVSADAGAKLMAILNEPAHPLSASEISSLEVILRERLDAKVFTLSSARTEDLNGKRVLRLEGKYLENHSKLDEIIVDAGRDGTVVQEIYFHAPESEYAQFAASAHQAMNSIHWK